MSKHIKTWGAKYCEALKLYAVNALAYSFKTYGFLNTNSFLFLLIL